MPDAPSAQDAWFEQIWTLREETLYRQFFGDIGTTIHTIPEALFRQIGVAEIDPRWLTHGVFESKPSAARPHWLYVTSALSNPWGQSPATANPTDFSGLGFEFTMETLAQSFWAISTLHWLMAMQILVATGLLEGGLVEYNDLVPLGASIDPRQNSPLRHLLLTQPTGYPARFQLPSGQVDFILCIGLTDREREFAKSQGMANVVPLLKHHGVFPLTRPDRASFI
jgi:hypothetical protein